LRDLRENISIGLLIITLYRPVCRYQYLEEPGSLKMEAVVFSKMLVSAYKFRQHNNPED
jgi:hypothetical protein